MEHICLSLSLSFIVPMAAMQYTNIFPADAGEYIGQGNRRNSGLNLK